MFEWLWPKQLVPNIHGGTWGKLIKEQLNMARGKTKPLKKNKIKIEFRNGRDEKRFVVHTNAALIYSADAERFRTQTKILQPAIKSNGVQTRRHRPNYCALILYVLADTSCSANFTAPSSLKRCRELINSRLFLVLIGAYAVCGRLGFL